MVFAVTRRHFISASFAMAVLGFVRPGLGSRARTLTEKERHTLRTAIWTLFPYHADDDSIYDVAVEAICSRCRFNPNSARVVVRGLAALDFASRGRFAQSDARTRVRMMKSLAGSDFLRVVYRDALASLYGARPMWDRYARAGLTDRLRLAKAH